MKNILKGSTTYLVGPIQYKDGSLWRQQIESQLKPMGIRIFNPYNHPFINSRQEACGDTQQELKKMAAEGKYDELSVIMKQIRREDLACVDLSTFIIAYIDTSVYTCGTWEEIFWANRLKRPIFLICEQGKQNLPLWMFGTIPHKYVYNTFDEVINVLKKIDSGEIEISSDRWKILRQEFLCNS